MPKSDIAVFILAKNEQRNIGRCLEKLKLSNWDTVVLDSGSTDETAQIVSDFEFAELRPYCYTDHCNAYNEITTILGKGYRYVMILDADMMVGDELQMELRHILAEDRSEPLVIEADILMFVEGKPLRFGSLCPAKAFVFAVGHSYFYRVGHGETLAANFKPMRTRAKLHHDDRKTYGSYLNSQVRYSRALVLRIAAGEVSGRDRLRSSTPLLIFVVPIVSYFLRGGFLSGKEGILYAIDRLIAEAIMFRRALSSNIDDT